MSTYFIEVPIRLLYEDRYHPQLANDHIYDHLKYFCSKFFPLPALDVTLIGERLVVTGGHNYLRAAQELGYPWLRAIYESNKQTTIEVLDELPPGIRITPNDVLERENATAVARDYHVYFFERALTAVQQEQFRLDIAGFFLRIETPLLSMPEQRVFICDFPFEGRCAEFEALVPVGDHTWFNRYLETVRKFSREVCRIVSFQGRHFST